jgi:phage/plasmid-like protein (TIGR03299 family)
MAHHLNYNQQKGQHSFFSVKEKAWHGLGQIVEDFPTSAEAMCYAGLDYTVEKRPLFTNGAGLGLAGIDTDLAFPEIEVPNFYATVRADNDAVLGVVGKDYQIVQNGDAFQFLDAIVGGGDGIRYETAGALGKGERIFITAKLPDYIRVGQDDLIEQYLFLTTSHDGLGSITAAFTPVRVVCQNTLNAALRNQSGGIRIRHTASARDRLRQAHTLMGISQRAAGELAGLFNHWAQVRITDLQLKKLISLAMAPNREVISHLHAGRHDQLSATYTHIVENAYAYALGSPTQQTPETAGTLFGAYNAVTGYFQNVRHYKSGEAKLKSILDGTARQRAQAAFDLCTSFTRSGADALPGN